MFTKAGGIGSVRGGGAPRRGLRAFAALLAAGSLACDNGGTVSTAPKMPGTIELTTETSGFMKDDGYELLVGGQSRGIVGANDEVTVSGLDPATYAVTLGDVAANCSADATEVSVGSDETATVSLAVSCAFGDPVAYTLRAGRARPDLDTGDITECPFSICSTQEAWDLYVYYSSASTPKSVIRQNQTAGVEIAHLPGVTLDGLTEADYQGAAFTAELVADPFDSGRVILIRTDQGRVYALGNPVEDATAQTLTFDAVLIVTP
jgi:hypothetical protein